MPHHLLLDNHPLALIVIARNRTDIRCRPARGAPHHHRRHRRPPRSIPVRSNREETRRGRRPGRQRYGIVRNLRMILSVLPEIVAVALSVFSLTLADVGADGCLAAAATPFAVSFRRRCCRRAVAARALHGAQGVRAALLAARVTAAADLRARDDGFAAHCSEAGEEGGEKGTQAGDCGCHDCVKDFGLAADCRCDAVEGWVGRVQFLGLVVDL